MSGISADEDHYILVIAHFKHTAVDYYKCKVIQHLRGHVFSYTQARQHIASYIVVV